MPSEKDKEAEILKKRRLAAKGLKPRPDGKPIDPMEDIDPIDGDPEVPESEKEKQKKISDGGLAVGLGLKR